MNYLPLYFIALLLAVFSMVLIAFGIGRALSHKRFTSLTFLFAVLALLPIGQFVYYDWVSQPATLDIVGTFLFLFDPFAWLIISVMLFPFTEAVFSDLD